MSALAAFLAFAVIPSAAQARFGLAPDLALDVHDTPGGAVHLTLPAHGLYFQVLEETPDAAGWLHIQSLPSMEPPYTGWVERAGVSVYQTVREARMAYFATHPLRDRLTRFVDVLNGGYWDLRDQGTDTVSAPGIWLRYGFDLAEWWMVRGQTYYAEPREIADILSADSGVLVLTIFTATTNTPPQRVEIEILGDRQVRIRQPGMPFHRFGRARDP